MRPPDPLRLLTDDDLIPDREIAKAEQDEFGHAKFATVVADLIEAAPRQGSLNIGIFGAWGSGKTGFLALLAQSLRERSEAQHACEQFKVVRYDAWKYGGESLQRHFITQVALSLEARPPNLYESEESQRLSISIAWRTLSALVPIVLLITALLAALAALAGTLTRPTSASFPTPGTTPFTAR